MTERIEYPLVMVSWRDAASNASWVEMDELPVPVNVQTVGYLVLEKPDYIVVCGTYSDHEHSPFSESIAIPSAWTNSVQRLTKEV